jgi:hypothetical protein
MAEPMGKGGVKGEEWGVQKGDKKESWKVRGTMWQKRVLKSNSSKYSASKHGDT